LIYIETAVPLAASEGPIVRRDILGVPEYSAAVPREFMR
jgi:hypothetical protein